ENSEGMGGVEAVGHCENIEYRAQILHPESRCPATDIHHAAAVRQGSTPKDERAGHDTRVISVRAELTPDAVQSYETDRAAMPLVVQANEVAAHEANVAVKIVTGALASVEVCADSRESQIGLGDHPAEISDDRGIASGQWIGRGIRRSG